MNSLSLKHVMLVVLATGMAVSSSFLGSALVSDKSWGVAAMIVAVLGVAEIALVAYRTEDEKLLAILKKKERDRLLREGLEAEAIDDRIRAEIKNGNLKSAKSWEIFRRRLRNG